MQAKELSGKIDHTILHPTATAEEVKLALEEARRFGFASACVSPCWVKSARAALEGSEVAVCTVAGFPHGTSKATTKAIEAISAIKEGAEEIDVVAHLPAVLAGDAGALKAELLEIVRGARAARRDVVIKVIVESALVMQLPAERAEAAMAAACAAVRESGCDFIKTSTGFHPAGGASVAAVRLMKKYGAGIRVKASGGIRDLAAALAMLEAGADRLGMSASVNVMGEILGEGNSEC